MAARVEEVLAVQNIYWEMPAVARAKRCPWGILLEQHCQLLPGLLSSCTSRAGSAPGHTLAGTHSADEQPAPSMLHASSNQNKSMPAPGSHQSQALCIGQAQGPLTEAVSSPACGKGFQPKMCILPARTLLCPLDNNQSQPSNDCSPKPLRHDESEHAGADRANLRGHDLVRSEAMSIAPSFKVEEQVATQPSSPCAAAGLPDWPEEYTLLTAGMSLPAPSAPSNILGPSRRRAPACTWPAVPSLHLTLSSLDDSSPGSPTARPLTNDVPDNLSDEGRLSRHCVRISGTAVQGADMARLCPDTVAAMPPSRKRKAEHNATPLSADATDMAHAPKRPQGAAALSDESALTQSQNLESVAVAVPSASVQIEDSSATTCKASKVDPAGLDVNTKATGPLRPDQLLGACTPHAAVVAFVWSALRHVVPQVRVRTCVHLLCPC